MTMRRKSNFQTMTLSIKSIIIRFIIGSILPLTITSATIEIAQVVGRNVSLTCPKSSSDDIIWRFNENTLLYDDAKFKGAFRGRSNFEMDAATGKEVLKISDIKPRDAGLYKCLTASNVELQSTQLTVLDSEPTCESNIKDNGFVGQNTCGINQDDMRFSCAVSYHGAAPRLQWEAVNGSQIIKDFKCDGSQPVRTNCNLTLKAEQQYDGSVFRCKVLTSHGEQHSCSTKVIKVLYFIPEEQALKPTPKAIRDKISCSVESNLELNFRWLRKENNTEVVVGTDRSYIIDKEGRYYCNVSYNIKDVSCWAVVSDVQANHTGSSPETNNGGKIAGGVIGGFGCVACVVLVVVGYRKLKKHKKKGAQKIQAGPGQLSLEETQKLSKEVPV